MERKIGRIEPAKFKSRPKAAAKSAPAKTAGTAKMEDDPWRAREDAHTLARAAAIKADPERLRKAVPEARKMAEEKSAELKGLRQITRRAK